MGKTWEITGDTISEDILTTILRISALVSEGEIMEYKVGKYDVIVVGAGHAGVRLH